MQSLYSFIINSLFYYSITRTAFVIVHLLRDTVLYTAKEALSFYPLDVYLFLSKQAFLFIKIRGDHLFEAKPGLHRGRGREISLMKWSLYVEESSFDVRIKGWCLLGNIRKKEAARRITKIDIGIHFYYLLLSSMKSSSYTAILSRKIV